MRFVKFEATAETSYVVPEHVVFLSVGSDRLTRIHLTNGEVIAVADDADNIGLRLQGRVTP